MKTTQLKVTGMTCGMCVQHVTTALQDVAGVQSATVDLASGTAKVQHDQSTDTTQLIEDVSSMRRKMREELDRSDAAIFDLKQGEGGLVDLEFLLQFIVLRDAASHPALLQSSATPALLDAARAAGPAAGVDLDQ